MGTPAAGKTLTLDDVLQRLRELEERIVALEQLTGRPVLVAETIGRAAPEVALSRLNFASVAKALLGLAGAYLLRAFAEFGFMSEAIGVAAGIAYSLCWLFFATRLAANDRFTALLYAFTSSLLFSGIVWENSVRLSVFAPWLAACAVAGFAFTGLRLARRTTLATLDVIVILTTCSLALALLVATRNVVPFSVSLLSVAVAVELAEFQSRSPRLRWFPAISADVAMFVAAWVVTRPGGLPEGYHPFGRASVAALQLALVVIYLGVIGYNSIRRHTEIRNFEIAQNITAIALFTSTSILMGREAPVIRLAGEVFCMLLGLVCYGISLFLRSHERQRRNVLLYGLFGLALVSVAVSLLFTGLLLVFVYCGLGVLAGLAGLRGDRPGFQLHSAVFLTGAALASGVFGFSSQALQGSAVPPSLNLPAIVTTAIAICVCYVMIGPGSDGRERVYPLLVAVLLTWTLLGLGAAAITGFFGTASGIGITLRTGLVCVSALLAGRFGHRRAELTWLVYPLMLYAAYRLFTQDFPNGRPTTLAISLLFYGGTLWALTAILRRQAPGTE